MKFEQGLWASLLNASTVLASSNSAADDFKANCASFASKLAVDGGKIHFSQFVPAGTNLSLSDNDPSCTQSFVIVLADICRVALSVATSKRSGLAMETWLPSNWTGRFLATGNGGLNGCVGYGQLAYASSLGFASAGTNNGHNGTRGNSFYNNTDVVADFAYRAMHTGVVVGKQVSRGFYGKNHHKSYYIGCSTGGRQGFKAAQDFPGDFDGIVAGAPAVSFNNLTSWSGHFYTVNGPPGSPTFVTQPQWLTVHADVLKQCDMLDGYKDGVIEDPLLCNYEPSGLLCPAGTTNSSTCLTATQLQTINKVYEPLLNGKGDLVYPRLQPGAEVLASAILLNGAPFPYSTDWFRYAIYDNASFDITKLNTTDYDNSARIDPGNIETFKGDLSGVRKRGTKVLHWHGGMDAVISSDNSPRYYEHVSRTMNLEPSQLDEFYRYFLISGTNHCSGGDGASVIGQQTGSVNSLSPNENVLMAMVEWVEKGSAPETIIGTRWVNGTQSLGVDYQRAHCKYPKHNQYKGTGDPKAIDSWECVNQKRYQSLR